MAQHRPRLRTPHPAQNGASPAPPEPPPPVPIKPLQVSGIVVSKLALIQSLQIYVPNLVDVQVFEDGDQFYLVFGETVQRPEGNES